MSPVTEVSGPTELTSDTFLALVRQPGIAVIDFWASWCGPCKSFAPVFAAAAARHPQVLWGKVDTEAESALAADLNVRSIPTTMVFRDGVLLFDQPGALPGPALDEIVQRVMALDMDEIRSEIASQASQPEAR